MKTLNIFLLTLIVPLVFFSCGKKSEEKTIDTEKKLPLVKVTEVNTTVFADEFKVTGVVKPFASATLSAEEGGLITGIPRDKGSYIGRGQVAVHLKKDVDIANYEQLEAQYELAKMNFEKQEQLWKENATTEIQYLTAKWQMEAASRGLNVLRTRLRTQYVRSPISGYVDERFMNRGEMTGPGTPILHIVDVSRVKISAGIPEKYVNDIQKGQEVVVTIDVLSGSEFKGKISYISPTLSSTSRTFEVEIIINNKDRTLKPEMSANVLISKSQIEDAIIIPQDGFVDNGDEKYLFVFENGIAKKRIIEVGGRNGNDVLVIRGLNKGDRIITEGFQSLTDGDRVEIGK